MKVKDLKPNNSVDSIELEIVSKGEPKAFSTARGQGSLCNCAGKDETGEVKITLWNEQIGQVEEGNKIKIENGWVSEYRGEKQLSTGRNGTLVIL